MNVPGAFSHQFAARRTERNRWGFDGALFDAIVSTIGEPDENIRVADLGCGVGVYTNALREYGFDARGFDGTRAIDTLAKEKWGESFVWEADLTTNLRSKLGSLVRTDWAVCIETGEHIPAKYEEFVFRNIIDCALYGAIVSWATPGQRGRDHVNCRTPEHIVYQMIHLAQGRLHFNEELTIEARTIAGKRWNKKLLVFTATRTATR